MGKTAFEKSAVRYASYEGKTWAAFVRTIVDGVVEGVASYDPTASNGKGAWKSGSWARLLDAMRAAIGVTADEKLPYMQTPTASVVGDAVRLFAPEIFTMTDEAERHVACDAFAKAHSKNWCNDAVQAEKRKGQPEPEPEQVEQVEQDEQESRAKIVADMFARGKASGYTVAEMLDEVIAQAS